mgnify:CR=1 FL=1
MLSTSIKIGDKLTCVGQDKSWKGLGIVPGDTVKCTYLDPFIDLFEIIKTDNAVTLRLYVNSAQLNAFFVPFIPTPSLTTLPPGNIQYTPPSFYSIGDTLVLKQWNTSFPGFVSNGDICSIQKVTSNPFVLFDLIHNDSGMYVGSFSEDELNKWFVPIKISVYKRVSDSVTMSMSTSIIKECDCGAKKTYGEQCNEFSHSTWCLTLKKD